MQLRYYQQEAVDAFFDALRAGANPVIALPTGSGKSLVIATIAERIAERGGKVVVLTHVQELIEQNFDEYTRLTQRPDAGVFSAGAGRYEVCPVTFAGIQSVYRKPQLFADFDLVLVDEAHMVPPDGEGLMYTSFMQALPDARKGGLTATPWRLDGGLIYGEGRYFDTLCYNKSALELVDEGYLCPLKGFQSNWQLDTSKLKKTAGDYTAKSTEEAMDDGSWLDYAVQHSVQQLKGRNHVVVFCPTVELSKRAAALYTKAKVMCGFVNADSDDRDQQLSLWKGGELRAMANVDILTTGFNFPALDAIVNLRPTQSTALWVQMLGRGMRNAVGKKDCLVLDYVGNLERLGGVGIFESWLKEKGDGKTEKAEKSGEARKPAKRSAPRLALTELDPMLESKTGLLVRVLRVNYAVARAKQPGKQHLLATYECETDNGVSLQVNQFCCIEYTGGARYHAEQWFKKRGGRAPYTALQARTDAYSLNKPKQLIVRKRDGYINVEREYF